MNQAEPQLHDPQEQETLLTELTIMPDGRLYVFGASRQVMDVLEALQPDDARIAHLMTHVRDIEQQR